VKLAAVVLAAVALAAVVGAAQAQQTPPRMPHPVAGKDQCLTCHAANANRNVRSQPATHQFPVATCAGCHQPLARRPTAVPHETGANFAQCRTCHKAGNAASGPKAPPAFHARYNAATCTMCHTHPAAGR
jgi:hypothetical protein